MANDLSVSQLEKLLDQKKSELDGLQRRRGRLQQELASVEKRITAIGGTKLAAGAKRSRKVRKRPKNDKTLLDVVLEVLGQNKKGLLLSDLSDKVLATGYKSASTKFSNTVYQCLYHNTDKITCDPATRIFKLK